MSQKRWGDWETALATIGNAALKVFFLAEIDSGRENIYISLEIKTAAFFAPSVGISG